MPSEARLVRNLILRRASFIPKFPGAQIDWRSRSPRARMLFLRMLFQRSAKAIRSQERMSSKKRWPMHLRRLLKVEASIAVLQARLARAEKAASPTPVSSPQAVSL